MCCARSSAKSYRLLFRGVLPVGDSEHLERAEAILAEIGAEWDLVRARDSLTQLSSRRPESNEP